MAVNVRYFAAIRERLGSGAQVPLAEMPSPTVGYVREWLSQQSAAHAEALDLARGVRAACNQTLCDMTQPVQDGDEVAFFPPVTGG